MENKLPRFIGVIHLSALPGSGQGQERIHPHQQLQNALTRALEECKLLEAAGFQGLMLENFGDVPFFKDQVPSETLSAFSIIAHQIRSATKLPLGINVLRNDSHNAMAIASVCGADFIRVNVLCGASVTDQGIIEGSAAALIRYRQALDSKVRILADVLVKHATPLMLTSLEVAIEDTLQRGCADGVILTGSTTGREANPDQVLEASQICKRLDRPLYVGSGITPKNLKQYNSAHGFIIGSAFREGGKAGAPVDKNRLNELESILK